MSKTKKLGRLAWWLAMAVSAGALAFIGARVGIGAGLGWMEKATGCDHDDDARPEPMMQSMFQSLDERRAT